VQGTKSLAGARVSPLHSFFLSASGDTRVKEISVFQRNNQALLSVLDVDKVIDIHVLYYRSKGDFRG
jgi:hypothetical protein